MVKLAIVHFQPIERFPPVMNFINSIIDEKSIAYQVYTMYDKDESWFSAKEKKIYRIGKPYLNPPLRYLVYLKFNFITFLKLVLTKPKIVIGYETYSLLPVFFYKILFKQTKILIHYHEYVSPSEIKNSSIYYKCLYLFEKKLITISDFISQTNVDRLELFLLDNPTVLRSRTFVAPNLPPSSWYEYAKLNKHINTRKIIKLVHVGAVGLGSMYVKEIIDWVVSQNGKYRIDFYASNICEDAKELFENEKSEYIRLLNPIKYFDLPKTLINYDIGVTMYNGLIPNFIWNVPNKVCEYLACGLNVWYSRELVSTFKFVEQNRINGCNKVDFLKLDTEHVTCPNAFNDNVFFEKTSNELKIKVLNMSNINNLIL